MTQPSLTDDISAEHPWPGLAAFSESASDFFRGRAQATQALTRLVGTSHAAVLFGQSGLGKTSLIRAGLFPELRRDEYLPVYVRLDHAESAPPLARQIITALQEECATRGVDCPALMPDDSLWTWLHRQGADFWGDGIQLLTPVLVLDQFEELFTLGSQNEVSRARAAAFLDDLSGLVENRPPAAIRQRIELDHSAGREFDFARASFRLLISLREDFLPDFESLTPQLPSLRLNRMRLLPMSGTEALQVVADGGGTLVDAAVAERIVRFVAADRQDKTHTLGELAVEPSLLSLICRELNQRRQDQHLPQINADLLTGARDEILTDFYTHCLADLPPASITLVEEHLLSESGYRNSLTLEDALHLPQIDRAVIDKLVARRLLRLEERSDILRVELTHDLLTSVARERRSQRRQVEALAAAQREADANRRKMRRMMALAGVMLVMLLCMLGLGWLMLKKNQQMEQMARVSLTRQLAVQANEILSNPKPDVRPWVLGVLLALESQSLSPDVAGKGVVLMARSQSEILAAVLRGHEESVRSVAVSPDGKTVVSGSDDGTLRLWDAATGQPFGMPLRGHESGVFVVAFSPDGKTLVSGSDNGTLRLWDVATGQPIGVALHGHEARVISVAFSPDGKTLASLSDDHTLRQWDVANGQLIGEPLHSHERMLRSVPFTDESEVRSAAFSPDGTTLVSGSYDGTLRLWNVATGQPIGLPLRGHEREVKSVAFSPDGTTLVSGSYDGTLRLWNVATGQPVGLPLRGHEEPVRSVAFSPDGKILARGSDDGSLLLWEVATGQPIGVPLRGHESAALSIAFGPDGKTLVSGSDDKTLRLWDLATKQPIGVPLRGHEGPVPSVAFSPDGKTLVSGSSYRMSMRRWEVATGQPLGEYRRHEEWETHLSDLFDITITSDGKTMASGHWDGTLYLWNVATGQPMGKPLRGHENKVLSLAFSPDGKTLVSGSDDKTLRLWDVATRQPIGLPLRGHEEQVISVAFSPDGKTLASGSTDKTLRLWNVTTGQPIGLPLRGHKGRGLSLAFSPDGKTLVSGGDMDGTLRLWNVTTGQPISVPLRGHEGPVGSVAFSPDGKTLASGSYDKTLGLWDVNFAAWPALLCKAAGRNLTRAEWQEYIGDFIPYRKTCPDLPESVPFVRTNY